MTNADLKAAKAWTSLSTDQKVGRTATVFRAIARFRSKADDAKAKKLGGGLVKADRGIAKDMGRNHFDSMAPSPVKSKKAWAAVTQPKIDAPLPPDRETTEMYKLEIQAFLDLVQKCPDKLRRLISQRRYETWGMEALQITTDPRDTRRSSTEPAGQFKKQKSKDIVDQAVPKPSQEATSGQEKASPPGRRGSKESLKQEALKKAALAAVEAVDSEQPSAPSRQISSTDPACETLSSGQVRRPSASGRRPSKESAAQQDASKRTRRRSMSKEKRPERTIEVNESSPAEFTRNERIGGSSPEKNSADPCSPGSTTSVQEPLSPTCCRDIADEAPMPAMRRASAYRGVAPESESPDNRLGSSSSSSILAGFSPPSRDGWIKAPQGPWAANPQHTDWLYQPEEGVYFHVPTETLWREERFSSIDGPLRIQLADAQNDALDAKVRKAGTSTVPRTGWKKASSGSIWLANESCPGWMHQPDEEVYYHEPSDSMWREAKGGKGTDKIHLQRIEEGLQAPAATPMIGSPRDLASGSDVEMYGEHVDGYESDRGPAIIKRKPSSNLARRSSV